MADENVIALSQLNNLVACLRLRCAVFGELPVQQPAEDDRLVIWKAKQALATLTPREAKVLRMRFGIDMPTDHTREEIGQQFDVTRERIRQIEAKALRKLRHPNRQPIWQMTNSAAFESAQYDDSAHPG